MWAVGCFGPSATNELVTLAECRALYSGTNGCGGDDIVTVTTPTGSKSYDLWCPCFDADGSNVEGGSDTGTVDGSDASSTSTGTAVGEATPEYKVEFTLAAAGDVADYTEARVDLMRGDIAIAAGVMASDVAIEVTAGSVSLAVTITVASAAAAEVVTDAISPHLASAATASSLFTSTPVSVESAPEAAKTTEPTSGLSTPALVAIITAGSLVFLLLVLFVCRRARAGEKPLKGLDAA